MTRSLPAWCVPAAVLLLVGLDQATKLWVQQSMALLSSIPIVPEALHLTYYANHGAVAGIGRGWPATLPLLIGLGAVLTLGVTGGYWLVARRYALSWRAQTFVICTLTPLLCTLLDRSRQGYVVDFIDLRVLPVFNVADLLANAGLVFLALEIGPWLRRHPARARARQRADPALLDLRRDLRRLLDG